MTKIAVVTGAGRNRTRNHQSFGSRRTDGLRDGPIGSTNMRVNSGRIGEPRSSIHAESPRGL